MKYVILVGDGMADRPLKELGGRTVIEAAKTPNMDYIAKNGVSGMVQTVPVGMKPGSDVANLALFGYDPKKYFMGRGPLEALSLGIELGPKDVAFRCNTVKVENAKMKDYSAGHISTEESTKLIRLIDKEFGNENIKFYPGVSYRHIMVIKNGPLKAKCTPPHDITGKAFGPYLPSGKDADVLNILMSESYEILRPLSAKANMIWLWGQGTKPKMPKFPIKGAVITAVDLIKGIGKAIGLNIIKVPGATGYLDTNYLGKAQYALKSLELDDFVFVHVEAPDEAGHNGDLKGKIKAIEDFDKLVVGTILKGIKKFKNYKVLVVPDHPTPISIMTHSGDPVPFAIISSKGEKNGAKAYSESDAASTGLKYLSGPALIKDFIR